MRNEFDPAELVARVNVIQHCLTTGEVIRRPSEILNLDPRQITPELAETVGVDPSAPDWKYQVENRFAAARIVAESQGR